MTCKILNKFGREMFDAPTLLLRALFCTKPITWVNHRPLTSTRAWDVAVRTWGKKMALNYETTELRCEGDPSVNAYRFQILNGSPRMISRPLLFFSRASSRSERENTFLVPSRATFDLALRWAERYILSHCSLKMELGALAWIENVWFKLNHIILNHLFKIILS